MKIISYNVSWCKQEKIDWLVEHQDVDAFVIPECGNEDNIQVPEGFKFFWMGNYETKGLGAMVREDHKCELASWYNKTLNYALPIIIDDRYLLLAIWPTKREKTDSYIEICLSILNEYEDKISHYPTVIIGDYNVISNQKVSKPIFDWMENHHLYSAYHSFKNEEIGKEKLPSYYHQYKETAPFFIDYAFTNAEVKDYKLYTWDESKRMSDHVPQMVEIENVQTKTEQPAVMKKGKEYDCGEIEITTEQWYDLLKEPKAKQYIDVLFAFLREPEHKGSCYTVAKKHNGDPQSYNAKIMHYGKWIHNQLDVTIYGTDGNQTYWAIPMRYGWETKEGFVWQLRKELTNALQRILLDNLFAEFKQLHKTDPSYVQGELYKWELLQEANGQINIEIVHLLRGKNIVDNPRVDSVLKYLYEEKTGDLDKCVSNLLDENIAIDNRLAAFKDTMRKVCPQDWKNCANDERTAAAILTCKFPQKYTFYKYEVYQNLCNYLGIEMRKSGLIYSHFIDIINNITDFYGEDIQQTISDEISPYSIKPLNLAIQTVLWIFKDRIKNNSIIPTIEMEKSSRQTYIDLLKANHNIIFNGAPGTGKTYLAKEIAEEMGAQYKMVQFHPSYDYTDFVEGLRPVKDSNGNIGFERKDGVFKEFCRKALIVSETSSNENLFSDLNDNPTVWKVSLCGTGDNPIRTDCLENGWIRIGWHTYGNVEDFNDFEDFNAGGKVILRAFQHTMQIGDIVLSCFSEKEIDAIGIVVGDYEYHDNVNDYPRYRKVKWLVKGIQEDIRSLNRNKVMTLSTIYKLPIKVKDIVDIVNRHTTPTTQNSNNKKNDSPFIFIIDEINRGEISKIFGELFFSIDPGYRGEKGKVQTQYQNLVEEGDVFKDGFYVPENVYIIGTMNDIDRSVESMDFAMRRRFAWQEITAEESAESMGITGELRERMDSLNKVVLETEGLGNSYQVGAAMFLKVKETEENVEGNCGMTVDSLWNLNLKSLMKEYLRGLPEADDILQKMEDAYFLKKKAGETGTEETSDKE